MGLLEVEFTGLRAGSGPVTLGQANVLEWIGAREQERSEVLCSFVPVPAGRGVEDVRASLAILLARHEALRTTVEPGPPATQTVRGSGRLAAELHEIDGADVESVLRERIVARRFDFGRDLPFRVAVATRDGVPYLVALALSHLAGDFASIAMVPTKPAMPGRNRFPQIDTSAPRGLPVRTPRSVANAASSTVEWPAPVRATTAGSTMPAARDRSRPSRFPGGPWCGIENRHCGVARNCVSQYRSAATTIASVKNTNSDSWMKYRDRYTEPGEIAIKAAADSAPIVPNRFLRQSASTIVPMPNTAVTRRMLKVVRP